MHAKSDRREISRFVAVAGALSLVMSVLLVAFTARSADAAGPFAFDGTGYGAIPDGGNTCPSPGAQRDVTFAVTGVPERQLADVRITGLAVAHTWVGDLTVTLIAPNAASMIVFGRTGATNATHVGDSSNTAGPYTFADTDTPAPGDWWATATNAGLPDAGVIPSGSYRASAAGGAGSTGTQTDITPAFNGVTNPNGTWTLRFTDGCTVDTGSVTAATLSLTPVAPDCTTQQAAVTTAQNHVTSAEAAQATAATNKTAADAAVDAADANAATADGKVAAADAKVAAADAKVASAQAKVAAANAKVAKAKGKVKKAKQALKTAKAGGDAAKIAKAQKKLAKAKSKLKAAKAAAKTANGALTAAKSEQTTAKSEQATAKSEQTAAYAQQATANANQATAAAAVTAANEDKAAADAELSAAQAALATCQASRPGTAKG